MSGFSDQKAKSLVYRWITCNNKTIESSDSNKEKPKEDLVRINLLCELRITKRKGKKVIVLLDYTRITA